MYKILLVEDEPEVLNAMVSTLHWNDLGFETPVACAHGQAAIDAMEGGFVPHAVITDICMPFVDGVQLTAYISEHLPATLVVMLTGYDDFSYAHKAIKLKVYDYVLKPITPNSLRELATKLCNELDERRVKNTDEFDALARERFLTSLLTAQLDEKTICDGLRVHKIPYDCHFWLVMAIDLSLPAAVSAQQHRNNELLRYGLGNIAEELTEDTPGLVLSAPVKDTHCVILCGRSERDLQETAKELAGRIAQACTGIGEAATAGIGATVTGPSLLYESYQQPVMALHYRFFYGTIPYICSDDVTLPAAGDLDYPAIERTFGEAVKRGNRADGQAAVCKLFDCLQRQKVPYPQCLRYCQRIVLLLLDLIGEYLSREERERLERELDKSNFFADATLPQLKTLLLSVCNSAFDSFERFNEDDAVSRVRMAESYIKEHYNDEDLSLNTMRDKFSISVSYFSARFKATTGCTFVEYLTQVRIEKAKQQLEHTEKRAGEIAQLVGFADPHYFSVTFKRITGLTPREYRNLSHSKNTGEP